jgi:hypothetical protein
MAYASVLEDALESVRSYFEDYAESYLQGIEAAKADGISLESMRMITTADVDPYEATEYPMCNLVLDEYEQEEETVNFDSARTRVAAIVAINKGSKDTIRTKLYRYAEAFREMLRDARDNGVDAWVVDFDEPIRIQVFVTPTESVKVALLRFAVLQHIQA